MTIQTIDDLRTTIGEVLQLAGGKGALIQPRGELPFAVMPLDDELLDFLIERDPQFIEDCRQIRQRMASGKRRSHAEVNSLFGRDSTR